MFEIPCWGDLERKNTDNLNYVWQCLLIYCHQAVIKDEIIGPIITSNTIFQTFCYLELP